jgi:drug/metabolite transporter (DMT)-like permease
MGFGKFEAFLALGMLITGSINTLATKLADTQSTKDLDGDKSKFNHPFVQALSMFMGELCCLCLFYIMRYRERNNSARESLLETAPQQDWSPWIFLPPAMCDMTATSLMYVGLNLTYASTYQMLRGSVVIFTGLMSMFFLKRRLQKYQWLGMFLVLCGLGVVGLVSAGGGDDDASDPMLGNVLIVAAQIVVAAQMVIEEKWVGRYDLPALQVVGLEGLFGCCLISFVLFILYFIPKNSAGDPVEDTPDAFYMIGGNWLIAFSILGSIVSIAFFNWFGISVTKAMSATTRMVLDSLRTFIIWGISLWAGWESFEPLQIIGFVLLLSGTAIYNRIIKVPYCPHVDMDEATKANKGQIQTNGDGLEYHSGSPSNTYLRQADNDL